MWTLGVERQTASSFQIGSFILADYEEKSPSGDVTGKTEGTE
jgi:hypothetical protein